MSSTVPRMGRTRSVPAVGRRVVRSGQVTDRSEAELDVAGDRVGECAGGRVGADDQHVARVVAARPQPHEDGPDPRPRQEGQRGLAREQQEQEEAADVGELDQEERREHDDGEEQDRDEDVGDLAPL